MQIQQLVLFLAMGCLHDGLFHRGLQQQVEISVVSLRRAAFASVVAVCIMAMTGDDDDDNASANYGRSNNRSHIERGSWKAGVGSFAADSVACALLCVCVCMVVADLRATRSMAPYFLNQENANPFMKIKTCSQS